MYFYEIRRLSEVHETVFVIDTKCVISKKNLTHHRILIIFVLILLSATFS